MSFLAPGFLIAAGALAIAVALLHLIVTREPDLFPLPTARFAPERLVQARARTVDPSDLLLLALRVALVLAVGAALATPIVSPPRRELIRIVLLDRSRGVASAREAADSTRSVLGSRDILILFDSAASPIGSGAADSLARLSLAGQPGRLSTALIAALRVASRVRDQADSFELIVVSPLVEEAMDAATDSVRALWPAAIRWIRTAARPDSGAPPISFEGPPTDPLRLALPVAGGGSSAGSIRVVRRLATGADSLWAEGAGRVLVVWPASLESPPRGWTVRSVDTVGAVLAGTAVVVAPFARTLGVSGSRGRVVARWVDGAPAAVEEPWSAGCIRTVTIDVPVAGDLVLDARFANLVTALAGPCGDPINVAPLGDAARARLAGVFGTLRASAASFPATRQQAPSRWARWLLLGALLLVVAEIFVRRRTAR